MSRSADDSARFVVVGCGTVVPEADRACSCYYLEVGSARILMDCGPGAVQALARLGLPWASLTHLILTHFHTDHVGDVPGLFFALKHGLAPDRRVLPLQVLGPPGTRQLFHRLAAALGDYLLDPGFEVQIREVPPEGNAPIAEAWLRTRKTPHTPESQAVRLEMPAAAVVYTGDTGPDPELGEFSRGATLLVCECSLPDDLAADNHLSPAHVARLATAADPAHLLLTHIYPQFRASADIAVLVRAAGYGGRLSLAHEGWSMRLPI